MRRLRVADIAANVAHGFIDVAVGHGKIEPAIEIDIEESTAEAQTVLRGQADARLRRNVLVSLSCRTRTGQSFRYRSL